MTQQFEIALQRPKSQACKPRAAATPNGSILHSQLAFTELDIGLHGDLRCHDGVGFDQSQPNSQSDLASRAGV